MIKIYFISFFILLMMLQFNSCKDKLIDIKEQEENIKIPDSLNIISFSERFLMLTWQDNSTAEIEYAVERGDGYTPQTYTEIARIPANVTEFTDSNLIKTNIYSYRVKAVGEYLDSDYSPKISVEIVDGTLLKSYEGHSNAILAMALSPNGQILATAGMDNTIILWDLNSGNQIYQLTEHYGYVYSLDFSPDGSMLASGSDDDWVIIWNVQTGDTIRKIHQGARPNSIAFSIDNQMIAAGLSDNYLPVWDVTTGTLITNLTPGYSGSLGISSIDFSPDGSKIVGFYGRSEIRMWDVNNANELWVIQVSQAQWSYVSFRPDGLYFAIANGNKVELRRSNNGGLVREYNTQTPASYSVAFSVDGQRIISGSQRMFSGNSEYFANIWDVNTGDLLYTISENSFVVSVLFTPDNQNIITATSFTTNNDGVYKANLWKLESKWVVLP